MSWTSAMPQWGKNLPGMQETQVQSLGQEDPLEEKMANVSDVVKKIRIFSIYEIKGKSRELSNQTKKAYCRLSQSWHY